MASFQRTRSLNIFNPATAEVIATMPLSPVAEIDATVQAASVAFKEWRQTPAGERVQYLFKFKSLLEDNLDGLAQTVTNNAVKPMQRLPVKFVAVSKTLRSHVVSLCFSRGSSVKILPVASTRS